jgi:hypothetical protein
MLPQVARSPSSAASLPEALTAQILQHVPQQERLQQCAFVCKAWASAAALATIHVQQKLQEDEARSALEGWLQKHGGHLESLQLSHSETAVWAKSGLQLPWAKLAKLQRLQLEGVDVTLPGEDDSSSSTPGADLMASSASSSGEGTHAAALLLPCLQHLQLSGVELFSISSLLQLAGAGGLTSLRAHDISFAQFAYGTSHDNPKAAVQKLAAAIPSLLQQLPRVAVLELPGFPMSAAAMQQLGCMQGLQRVSLEHVDHMPPCELQHLPSSITQLQFQGNLYGLDTGPRPPPQLQQLTGLLELTVQYSLVQPTVLGPLTCLQGLRLLTCRLPLADAEDYDTEATAALLDALSKMTCLQDLSLSLDGLDTVSTAPQRFAALTASTQLTSLALNADDKTPLPRGAAQYMFPAGRQLPFLEVLTISPTVDWRTDLGTEEEWCLDGSDICSIIACCTGLEDLDIGHIVRPGGDACTDYSCIPPALLLSLCRRLSHEYTSHMYPCLQLPACTGCGSFPALLELFLRRPSHRDKLLM